MTDEWVHCTLADACSAINYGLTASASNDFTGPKFLRITDIVSGQLDWNTVPHVVADDEIIVKYRLYDGDIVIARTGASTGVSLYVKNPPSAVFASYLVRLQAKSDFDARFLAYYLKSEEFWRFIRGVLGDKSAQPNASASTMISAPLIAPKDKTEQRAIAHILGTLDDKIELNRRMNKTLEAMARALFKSWFVDFDPVRAKMAGRDTGLPSHLADLFPDRLVDSELGKIPEGWEVKALEEFGDVITGKTPSTRIPEFYGDDVPFLKIPDMHGQMYVVETSTMLSSVGASSQALKTLPSGSISVSCIATPGLVVLNHRNIQTNQQINSIIPRDRSLSKYIYWSCRHLSTDIKAGGLGGSVFGNMNKSIFSALPVLNPKSAAIRAFDQFVSPIHAAILANEKQSQTLAEGRDSLLPKLISGDLRTQVAESIVEIS